MKTIQDTMQDTFIAKFKAAFTVNPIHVQGNEYRHNTITILVVEASFTQKHVFVKNAFIIKQSRFDTLALVDAKSNKVFFLDAKYFYAASIPPHDWREKKCFLGNLGSFI